MPMRFRRTHEPPNWPTAMGIPGLAAIFLAYKVSCALLGGTAAEEMEPTVEESVTLARRSGMPGAMVISLNSLAMTLAERDPNRAKAVLRETLNSLARPAKKWRRVSSPPPWSPRGSVTGTSR